MTLVEDFDRSVRMFPRRPAMVFGERRLNWHELGLEVNRAARLLLELGVRPGDRVVLYSVNSDQFVIAVHAIFKVGGVLVTINPRSAAPEVRFFLQDSGAKLLLFGDGLQDTAQKVCQELTEMRCLALTPGTFAGDFTALSAQASAEALENRAHEDDNAEILYTSGTTGVPKGVVLTHRALRHVAVMCATVTRMPLRPRTLHVAPLYHSAQLNLFLNATTLLAGCHIVLPTFDPVQVIDTIERERVQVFFGPPTMYQFLLKVPGIQDRDVSSLEVGAYGAAPMPLALLERIRAVLPDLKLCGMYGLSEMGPGGVMLTAEDHATKAGAGGLPAPGLEVRIVDEEGQDVPPGVVGEKLLRGTSMMKEYWQRPEQTAEAIRDGWLHTGDLAMFDEDGYVYAVDRKKDMIISGGMNIYPAEVEAAIIRHDAVRDVAVVGRPHPDYGETVVALVSLHEGAELPLEDLRMHCLEHIADYKIPRAVIYGEVPRNLSGKILKQDIRKLVVPADRAGSSAG